MQAGMSGYVIFLKKVVQSFKIESKRRIYMLSKSDSTGVYVLLALCVVFVALFLFNWYTFNVPGGSNFEVSPFHFASLGNA